MKTIRHNFERELEKSSPDNIEWLKSSYKSILESDKPFTKKADYIGYSILSLDEKISSIDEDIAELRELKTKLKEAKDVAITAGAEVFSEYGIDKLEGLGISSITITEAKQTYKSELVIKDEVALMQAGYFKMVVNTDRVLEEFNSADHRKVLEQYCDVTIVSVATPSKLKVNKRRSSSKSTATVAVKVSEYEPMEEILTSANNNSDCPFDSDSIKEVA